MSKAIKSEVWGTDHPHLKKEIFDSLRPIAQKQIISLLRRLAFTRNLTLYQDQIKKTIQYEQGKGGAHLHD